MRLSKLLVETKVSDIFPDTFESFISDYNLIYSRNLFVVFSNEEISSVGDLETDPNNNLPVAFPIKSVLNDQASYTDYAEYKFLNVIQINGSIFYLSKTKLSHVKELSKVIGLGKEDFDFMIGKFSDNYKTSNPSIESYMFSKLLFNDVEIKDNEMKLSRVSTSTIQKRMKKMGISVIVQNENSGNNLISKHFSTVAIINDTFRVNDRYELMEQTPKDKIDAPSDNSHLYFRDAKYMRGIASEIAQGLGTHLNSDPSYSIFLDYYFWTVDGIEIVITVAFGKEEESETHDNVYYIVEADTPYGVVVHRIHVDQDIDVISDEIADVYKAHVVPNDDWKPTNRDIFLDSERREYKLFDQHYDDVVSVVDEFYPIIQRFGRQYNLNIPLLSYFGNFDKIYIHQFVEFLASNPTPAVQLIDELIEKDYDFNQLFYVPMPRKITVDVLKNIAMIYANLKARRPNIDGWHLFKMK